MKIIFLTHHEDFKGYSLIRYANFLNEGLKLKGHSTQIWKPKSYLTKTFFSQDINKWLRYIDTFILFPIWFKLKSMNMPKNTLYVLVDQALGMWVPMLKTRKHVVHCHDFIALKSALGIIKENPTSLSGKKYQNLILKGFSKANNFICISKNTQKELTFFIKKQTNKLEVIYNPIDPKFKTGNIRQARKLIGSLLKLNLDSGYLLHVGGNHFYKNRTGVITLYNTWRKLTKTTLPLIMIGNKPSDFIEKKYNASPYRKDIHFLANIDDEYLVKAYQGAITLIFPSLEEGFGWPIVEAMASGCPVITTAAAPMNEIGGDAAVYIDRCPLDEHEKWAIESAKTIESIIQLKDKKRADLIQKGYKNTAKFNSELILKKLENVYSGIVSE